MPVVRCAAALIVIVMGTAAGRATQQSQVHWNCPQDKMKELCDATKIADARERTEAIIRALKQALVSPDQETRRDAFEYLCRPGEECAVDPRELREALAGFDKLEGRPAGTGLLDDFELQHAPREARLRVYLNAITDGEARSGHGSEMVRSTAMVRAAREGLGELKPVIQDHHPDVAKAAAVDPDLSLDYLLATIDLRDGIEDTPVLRASRRLAAMPTRGLWEKIDSNEGRRRASSQTVEEACKAPTSEACEVLKPAKAALAEIVRPLLKAEAKRRAPVFDPQQPVVFPGEREVQLRNLLMLLEGND